MQKKIAKQRAAALGNMRNIREKEKQKYVPKHAFFPCLQEITIPRGTEYGCIIS